jgi:hypothetical protein
MVVTRNAANVLSLTSNVGINTSSPSTALHVVGNVRVDGSILATGDVAAFSDRRLKTDLVPISSGLCKLERLTGYTYGRTDLPGRFAGLVAQEVEAVLPEAVSRSPDGLLAVSASSVLALVVEGIKQVTTRLDSATTRLDQVEGQVMTRLDSATTRLDQVEGQVMTRLDQVMSLLIQVSTRLDLVEAQVSTR